MSRLTEWQKWQQNGELPYRYCIKDMSIKWLVKSWSLKWILVHFIPGNGNGGILDLLTFWEKSNLHLIISIGKDILRNKSHPSYCIRVTWDVVISDMSADNWMVNDVLCWHKHWQTNLDIQNMDTSKNMKMWIIKIKMHSRMRFSAAHQFSNKIKK